jgi:2-iminobutanoate/2-iminopropanoate deaminase
MEPSDPTCRRRPSPDCSWPSIGVFVGVGARWLWSGRDRRGWLDRLEAQHRRGAGRAGAFEREEDALQVARRRNRDVDEGVLGTGDAVGAQYVRDRGDLACEAGVGLRLELLWDNIRAILASAGMTADHIVRVTSYLRDAADADANGRARVAALGGRVVPTTAIVVQTLSDAWLVEVEVVAAA